MTKLAETVSIAKVATALFIVSWATPRAASARKFATEAEAVAYAEKTRVRLAKRYDTPELVVAPLAPPAAPPALPIVAPVLSPKAHLAAIEARAVELIAEHGLAAEGWSFKWDAATKRAGVCKYGYRTIGLSKLLMAGWTFAEAEGTILHEIAHALTPGASHGPRWVAKCKEIGGDGERYWKATETTPALRVTYVGRCEHGHETREYRSNPGKYCLCPECRSLGHARSWLKFSRRIVKPTPAR